MTMQRRSDFSDSVSTDRFSESAKSPEQDGSPETTGVRYTDILSGRGKSYTKHPGNLRFDDIIKQNLQRYFSVTTHTDKKIITEEIVDEVTSLGRFLRYEKELKQWVTMDREAARIKVAQALQYRQRRVSKSLERANDSLEANPLPTAVVQSQEPRLNFMPLPQPAVLSQAVAAGGKRAGAPPQSQTLQYRKRRVSKGLAKEDDALQPKPLSPAEVQSQGPLLNFMTLPQSLVSSLAQVRGNSAGAPTQSQSSLQCRQHQASKGSDSADFSLEPIPLPPTVVQSQGARLHFMPQSAGSPRAQFGGNRASASTQSHATRSQTFDFDDTSIGVAAAHLQNQRQRDQQALSRHIETLLSQQRILHQNNPPSNISSDPSQPFASMGTFTTGRLLDDNVQTDQGGDFTMRPSSLQEQQINIGTDFLHSLEPRPIIDSSFTGVPSHLRGVTTRPETLQQNFITQSQRSAQYHPQEQQQRQESRIVGQQHQPDDSDDYSLSNFLNDAVNDEDTDQVSSWDDPTFDDGQH